MDDAAVLAALAQGATPTTLVELTGVQWAAVQGRSRWDQDWAQRVDTALMAGRPDTDHGTWRGYRDAGCRCPDCRDWKAQDRRSAAS